MLFPHVESKRVVMCPALVSDAPAVYRILLRGGRTELPTLGTFTAVFDRGATAQFLVYDRATDELVGYGALTSLSTAGHVTATVATENSQVEPGIAPFDSARDDTANTDARPVQVDEVGAATAALLVNFAFAMWRLRKVYLETAEPDLASFGLSGPLAGVARREARLPGHLYFRGELWDKFVHAIYREDWDEFGEQILANLG